MAAKIPPFPSMNPAPDVRTRLRPFRELSADEEAGFAELFDGVVHAAD